MGVLLNFGTLIFVFQAKGLILRYLQHRFILGLYTVAAAAELLLMQQQ